MQMTLICQFCAAIALLVVCCGYRTTADFCVRRKQYGDSTGCCGSMVYDVEGHVCCDNTVLLRNYGSNTSCCGSSTISISSSQTCCDYPTRSIQNRTAGAYSVCCGSRVYDYRYYGCCSATVYNLATQVCCNNHSKPSNVSNGCCGSQTYNTQTQICCNEKSIQQKTFGNFSDCRGVIQNDTRLMSCCYRFTERPDTFLSFEPVGVYYFANQTCCGGSILPKTFGDQTSCCHNVTFNYSSQICCDTEVKYKSYGDNTTCCGTRAINYQATGCCYPAERPYSLLTQICCAGEVKDLTYGDRSSCCGAAVYDTNQNICCDGRLYRINTFYNCCGNTTYDSRYSICCYC